MNYGYAYLFTIQTIPITEYRPWRETRGCIWKGRKYFQLLVISGFMPASCSFSLRAGRAEQGSF